MTTDQFTDEFTDEIASHLGRRLDILIAAQNASADRAERIADSHPTLTAEQVTARALLAAKHPRFAANVNYRVEARYGFRHTYASDRTRPQTQEEQS